MSFPWPFPLCSKLGGGVGGGGLSVGLVPGLSHMASKRPFIRPTKRLRHFRSALDQLLFGVVEVLVGSP